MCKGFRVGFLDFVQMPVNTSLGPACAVARVYLRVVLDKQSLVRLMWQVIPLRHFVPYRDLFAQLGDIQRRIYKLLQLLERLNYREIVEKLAKIDGWSGPRTR